MQIIFFQLVTNRLMSYRVSYANNIRSVSYKPVNELVSYANNILSVSYQPVKELQSELCK
jgi:hypothetical protein